MRAPSLAIALLAAALAACDKGTVDLNVADAPVDDADAVVVQFTGVTLRHSNGDTEDFTFDTPKSIDLLAQTEGASEALLAGARVEDGDYTEVRLRISATGAGTDSWVDETGGARRALVLDASDEGRLRIPTTFNVGRGDRMALTVDFDLRKSVLTPDSASAPYALRPSLRLVNTDGAGAVGGTVSAALAGASGCRPAVYLYRGHGITPDDEGSAGAPFASAIVRAATPDFAYRIAFIPPGNYTAAFTCGAAADDPERDDATTFPESAEVTVSSGGTAIANFP